jgi:hypothetical protein
LLSLAEQLHLTALKLTKAAFGEMNVQTAKHYGNLGRLFQSMRKFEVIVKVFSPLLLCNWIQYLVIA